MSDAGETVRQFVASFEQRDADLLGTSFDDAIVFSNHGAPEVRGKAFLMGKWQDPLDITDPYRRPASAFEQTYAQLSRCIDDWLPHFQSGATG